MTLKPPGGSKVYAARVGTTASHDLVLPTFPTSAPHSVVPTFFFLLSTQGFALALP